MMTVDNQKNSNSSLGRPRIGILCLSAIADDPRVRRQGDLFTRKGWEVVAIGLKGARSIAPEWKCFEVDDMPSSVDSKTDVTTPSENLTPLKHSLISNPALTSQMKRYAKPCYMRIKRALHLARLFVDQHYGLKVFWTLNDKFKLLHNEAQKHKVDFWIANDWTTLPIAMQLSQEQNVPFAYDTHELAVDEYAQHWRWRLLQRPIIAAIETLGISQASLTSCVSKGISERLFTLYGLKEPPLVIRNMPHYETQPFRPCGEVIKVLYHGIVSPGRGLEACIESVAHWRSEFHFTIRGPVSDAYKAELEALITALKLEKRVTLAPPVPMIDLVKEAHAFDVGLFALPGHSKQNVHVLPNKFFEYTMAGLALCMSDLPEMTELLKKYDLGHSIPEPSPEAIATSINRFDRASIDQYKHNTLKAAHDLNWEAEAERFYQGIVKAHHNARDAQLTAV